MNSSLIAVKVYCPEGLLNSELKKISFIQLSDKIFMTPLQINHSPIGFQIDSDKNLINDINVFELNFFSNDEIHCNVIEGSTSFSTITSSNLLTLEVFSSYVIRKLTPKKISQEGCSIFLKPFLTKRELEVLKYVYEGHSNKQIASRINLSSRTVELHRQNSSTKLGALSPQKLQLLFSDSVLKIYSEMLSPL